MTALSPDVIDTVTLTERAARRITRIMSKDPAAKALRVSVEGGGCSGFSYKFDLTTARADDDLVIERDGATVLIDPVSLPFMAGSRSTSWTTSSARVSRFAIPTPPPAAAAGRASRSEAAPPAATAPAIDSSAAPGADAGR